MMAVVRPLVNTDLESLDRLRTLVHPHLPEAFDTDWNSSVWRWLGTHPLAHEMHRWVVATEEGEVVGHLAALPQFYRIGGQRVVAHASADYQVLPQYGRHAVLLMRKFLGTAENCVVCNGNSAVLDIATRLGTKEAGKLQFAVKVCNVAGIPGFPQSIPGPISQLLNLGLRTVDGVLSSTFVADDLKAEVVAGFDAAFDELFESVAATAPCVPEKNAAFLRWRYGPGSPQSSATLLGVRDGETLLGYAVLWVTRDGDDGYLLDLTTRPGRRDVVRSLLIETVRLFRRAGVNNIWYQFLESPTSPQRKDLWRLGFVLRHRRTMLLVKFEDQGLHRTALDLANWSYTTGDGEMTFWIR
jgi:hypothetical protein